MAQSDIAETAALERMSAAQSESLCADLVAHWTLFKGAELGDPGHLDTMLDIMEKAAPDLKYGPHTQDEGIQRFFDFDEELSKDFAVKMMTELKAVGQGVGDIDPALVVRVHGLLCKDDSDTGERLGDILPYNSLGFFLEECQQRIGDMEMDDTAMTSTLESIFTTVENRSRHLSVWTSSYQPGNGTKEELLEVIKVSRQLAQDLHDGLEQSAKAFEEENGALLKHASAQSLTDEPSLALDRDQIVNLKKQLDGIWATALAAKNRKIVARAQKLCEFMDEAMAKLNVTEDTKQA